MNFVQDALDTWRDANALERVGMVSIMLGIALAILGTTLAVGLRPDPSIGFGTLFVAAVLAVFGIATAPRDPYK